MTQNYVVNIHIYTNRQILLSPIIGEISLCHKRQWLQRSSIIRVLQQEEVECSTLCRIFISPSVRLRELCRSHWNNIVANDKEKGSKMLPLGRAYPVQSQIHEGWNFQFWAWTTVILSIRDQRGTCGNLTCPVELLITNVFWGTVIIFSYVSNGKHTRLQWTVANQWPHRQSWLKPMSHQTKWHNCEKGNCRKEG